MGDPHEFVEKTLKVGDGLGLHARVATMMVQAMQNYACRVSLIRNDVEVDARSVLGLLLLAAAPGTEIVVRALGPGSREAVEEITRLIQHEDKKEDD